MTEPTELTDARYAPKEIAHWRKKHWREERPIQQNATGPICGFCEEVWPCFTIAALDGWEALKAAREQLAQAEAEAQAMVDAIWDVHRECHECQSRDAYCPAHDRPALRAVARERRLAGLDVEPTVSLMWAHYALVRKSTAGGREWTLHHFEEWKQRAEAAEANCAALREALTDFLDRHLGTRQYGEWKCDSCQATNVESSRKVVHLERCLYYRYQQILANPNPGAGLLTELEQARTRIAELEARP